MTRISILGASVFASALLCTPVSALAAVTIAGRVSWVDARGLGDPLAVHPARHVVVDVCDGNLPVGADVMASGESDDMGRFAIQVPDPGVTPRALYVQARSESNAAALYAIGTDLPYTIESNGLGEASPNAVVTVDLVGSFGTTSNASFSVLDALLDPHRLVERLSSRSVVRVGVEFPSRDGTAYRPDGMHIGPGDPWDWDVVIHEYGHFIAATFDLDDNPGGPHALDVNLRASAASKAEAIKLAWAEGLATFFSIGAQREMNMGKLGVPNVGDDRYTDTEDSAIDVALSSDGAGSLGEDNEVSVMRILHDVVQGANATRTFSQMWALLASRKPRCLWDAWSEIRAHASPAEVWQLGVIASRHGVAPAPKSPADGAVRALSSLKFLWEAGNVAGGGRQNSQYGVTFFAADGTVLSQFENVPAAGFEPTANDLPQLTTQEWLWAVSASDADLPVTGPYWSVGRRVLNHAPVTVASGPIK
jgi:hypothetical protein